MLGRQTGGQAVSLKRVGCLFQSTVQHEVLHALGFHHEQVRSDRDQYVQILYQNILSGTYAQQSPVLVYYTTTRTLDGLDIPVPTCLCVLHSRTGKQLPEDRH